MLQKKQTQHKLIAKDYCEGTQKVLNFNNFSHGDEVLPDSIPGVTIEATRRATEPEPGIPEELLRAPIDPGHSRSRLSQL